MAWYEDLVCCDYFGPHLAPSLRAVGWLECGRHFATGPVVRRVYERLVEFRAAPWSPALPMAAGVHECDLCLYDGKKGNRHLFVPGVGVLYVAPELIVHYMNAHGYQPPQEFCHAVLVCPPMGSMAYLQAVLANGGRPLARQAGASRAIRARRPW